MNHGLTLELARQANLVARSYHPGFYCSIHEGVADLPAEPPEYPGGPFATRSVRVHFVAPPRRVNLLTAESTGDDEALLTALHDTLIKWQLSDAEPEDALLITEERAAELLTLATHPLTAATDRQELLGQHLRWHTEQQARAVAADLTAKIEARSPGVITGRGWMPHGEVTPRASPHPFAS